MKKPALCANNELGSVRVLDSSPHLTDILINVSFSKK